MLAVDEQQDGHGHCDEAPQANRHNDFNPPDPRGAPGSVAGSFVDEIKPETDDQANNNEPAEKVEVHAFSSAATRGASFTLRACSRFAEREELGFD